LRREPARRRARPAIPASSAHLSPRRPVAKNRRPGPRRLSGLKRVSLNAWSWAARCPIRTPGFSRRRPVSSFPSPDQGPRRRNRSGACRRTMRYIILELSFAVSTSPLQRERIHSAPGGRAAAACPPPRPFHVVGNSIFLSRGRSAGTIFPTIPRTRARHPPPTTILSRQMETPRHLWGDIERSTFRPNFCSRRRPGQDLEMQPHRKTAMVAARIPLLRPLGCAGQILR